jgi:IMP dehydrogenase
MLGSMLAGVSEAPGDIIYADGRQWKTYRGMGSVGAMLEHVGSRERYLQEDSGKDRLVPEGVTGRVAYKGKLGDILHQYVGGLRKGMGYVGAATILEMQEKGDFVRLTSAGLGESRPHDINITESFMIGIGLS